MYESLPFKKRIEIDLQEPGWVWDIESQAREWCDRTCEGKWESMIFFENVNNYLTWFLEIYFEIETDLIIFVLGF